MLTSMADYAESFYRNHNQAIEVSLGGTIICVNHNSFDLESHHARSMPLLGLLTPQHRTTTRETPGTFRAQHRFTTAPSLPIIAGKYKLSKIFSW